MMKIIIDTDHNLINTESGYFHEVHDLYSPASFEIISKMWIKVGWNQKYSYGFSWMGRPIIQLPADMIRIQEVIYRIKPDVIIETGIAHGGSLIYYASLCQAMGEGRVVGIDIEIRPHNRRAIEAHELFPRITLVEGSSTDPAVLAAAKRLVEPGETVLVVLDSCHSMHHVLAELESYHALVTPGSYIVVTDGIMKDLHDVPRGKEEWAADNPTAAAAQFVQRHPEFVIEQPARPFNESELTDNVTHWPGAWLRRQAEWR